MDRNRIRWWPAVLVLAGAGIALAVIWGGPEMPRQQQNIRTAIACASAGALLLAWFFGFSRVSRKLRWIAAALLSGSLLLFIFSFRMAGVSGDLVPILEPRWKARPLLPAELNASVKPSENRMAGEFPQFYGPNRNGVLAFGIETNWTEHPPRVVWRQPVGPAWSGFAIRDGLAVTLEQRAESEFVVCYDARTGQTLWAQGNSGRYATTIAGVGPRTTPTIASNQVFTLGATGILSCFELATGRRVWSRDVAQENDAPVPEWGFSSSPLVLEGKVIVSAGGKNGRSLVAYSAADGAEVWAQGEGAAAYSSPIGAKLLGTEQILIFHGRGVRAHALDGQVLWDYPWPSGHPHVSLPVVIGTNQVLISSGYGTGAELIQLERAEAAGPAAHHSGARWKAARVWKSLALKSKFGPIFVKNGYIYGLDDGMLTCVELKTGQRVWKEGRYGHGQALLAGEVLLVSSEKGEIILIDPSPENLREVARFSVLAGKTWNPPALAGEYLLLRNDQEAACLQLARSEKELAKNLALSFAKQFSDL